MHKDYKLWSIMSKRWKCPKIYVSSFLKRRYVRSMPEEHNGFVGKISLRFFSLTSLNEWTTVTTNKKIEWEKSIVNKIAQNDFSCSVRVRAKQRTLMAKRKNWNIPPLTDYAFFPNF